MTDIDQTPLTADQAEINAARADWANEAIDAFATASRSDWQDDFCDLLSAMMHLADREGRDFNMVLSRARTRHEAEAGRYSADDALKPLAFAARIARMTQDGEEVDGKEFVMENDEAVATLNGLIDEARGLVAEAEGIAA